ncbi:universal stress protein, partial [Candidatus Entotheonella palauensis]
MYTNILVATGGSPWSDAAVAYAIAIASRTGAKLHILTVLLNPSAYTTPDVMGGVEVVADVVEYQGRELLAQAEAKARAAQVDAETMYRWGSVPDTILQMAAETACDLMVLGARQLSGWKRLRLGRHVNAVAAKARRPVLVVKAPPAAAPGQPLGRRILVATGGSPWSDMAVEHAIQLAQTERFSLC